MIKQRKRFFAIVSIICCIAIFAGIVILFPNNRNSDKETVDYKSFIAQYREKTLSDGFKTVNADISLSVGENSLLYNLAAGDFEITTPLGNYRSSLNESEDSDSAKLLQSSLLYIEYFDKSNNLMTMSSRKDSLKNSGAELYIKGNTLRILYTMGKDERTYFLPLAIRADVFENDILPQLNSTDSRKLKKYYRKYEVGEKLTNTEKNEILKKYPAYEDMDIYVYIGGDSVKLQSSFEEIFRSAGFDENDYSKELEELRAENFEVQLPTIFFVPVEFTIDSDRFIARIINDGIVSSNPELYLVNIYLLPCFGSSNVSNGYMVLPDGGGSYVDLSEPNVAGVSFTKQIYGNDIALTAIDLAQKDVLPSTKQQDAYIPSYLFASGDGSYTATVTHGAEYASFNAKVMGNANAVNAAGFSFTYRPYQIVETGSTDQMMTIVKYSKESVKTDFEVVYQLTGTSSEKPEKLLSELKQLYQQFDYLPADNGISSSETLFIDMYCLVVDEKTKKTEVLSTFKEIEQLLIDLNKRGIKDCVVTLKAVSDDGIEFSFKDQLKISRKLGGNKGLRSLSSKAKELGFSINLSWNLSAVYSDKIFDGFGSIGDASKNIEQLIMHNEGAYILSPDKYDKAVLNTLNSVKKIKDSYIGITFENNGLTSNLDKKGEILREELIFNIKNAYSQISKERKMVASAPYLPFAETVITDVVLNSSHNIIQTSEFPFVAYLYNKNTLYSGQSINLADDPVAYSKTVMNSGAALKVSWMIADDTKLIDSDYSNSMYSLCYKDNIDDIIDLYLEYNSSSSSGSVYIPENN